MNETSESIVRAITGEPVISEEHQTEESPIHSPKSRSDKTDDSETEKKKQ